MQKPHECDIIQELAQGYSSVGRVLVSKTKGRGFKSFCPFGFVLFQVFPNTFLQMFSLGEEAITTVGVPALRTISISFIFAGFSIICGAVFQAFGYSTLSMLISIGRQLVTLLPVAYLLALTGNINYVWWAYPIAELVCVILSVVFFAYIYKTRIATIPDEPTKAELLDI